MVARRAALPTPDSCRECAEWPPARPGCLAEPTVRPGLGRGVPAGALPVRPAPSFNPRCAFLTSRVDPGGRGRGDLVYPPTAVPVYRESVCRGYLGESLLAGRADVGGRDSKNKDYADSGALPKCVGSPHKSDEVGQVRVLFSQICLFEGKIKKCFFYSDCYTLLILKACPRVTI